MKVFSWLIFSRIFEVPTIENFWSWKEITTKISSSVISFLKLYRELDETMSALVSAVNFNVTKWYQNHGSQEERKVNLITRIWQRWVVNFLKSCPISRSLSVWKWVLSQSATSNLQIMPTCITMIFLNTQGDVLFTFWMIELMIFFLVHETFFQHNRGLCYM